MRMGQDPLSDRAARPRGARLLDAGVALLGAGLVGLVVVTYCISFAAILWSGPLTPFLSTGIGLTLLGSAAATAVGAATCSVRGMLGHSQDTSMLVLFAAMPPFVAALAATGAGPETVLASSIALVVATSMGTGLLVYAAGALRLSFVTRFLPYPVIGGLLVSIGYLLVLTSVSIALGRSVTVGELPELARTGALGPWWPWALGAVALAAARARVRGSLLLPAGMILGLAAFYGALALGGSTLGEASARGLLLGPFGSGGFLGELDPDLFGAVHWGTVLAHLPVTLAIAGVTLVGGVLNVQTIAQALGQEPDLDRDLRSIGLSNLAGGALGGIVAYPSISATLLGRQCGLPAMLAALAVAVTCVAVALGGAGLMSALPRGLFAMIVCYLGIDLALLWLRGDGRRLPARDLAPALAILATTVVADLTLALVVGIAVAMGLFIVSYARLPFIHSDTTLALRRSIVERSEADRAVLAREGQAVRILQLSGALFFGTAHALRQHLRALVGPDAVAPARIVLLDFRAVRDIDASAATRLVRTLEECMDAGVAVWLSGLRPAVAERLERFDLRAAEARGAPLHLAATLDDALQEIEARLIAEVHGETAGDAASPGGVLEEMARAVPDLDFAALFPAETFEDGAAFIAEGAPSDDIFVLLEGRAEALVQADGAPLVVARFEPGALIGEMAFYQGTGRSASVVARGRARVIRIEAARLAQGGDLPEAAVIAFHRVAARLLSQRLDRATRLIRESAS